MRNEFLFTLKIMIVSPIQHQIYLIKILNILYGFLKFYTFLRKGVSCYEITSYLSPLFKFCVIRRIIYLEETPETCGPCSEGKQA